MHRAPEVHSHVAQFVAVKGRSANASHANACRPLAYVARKRSTARTISSSLRSSQYVRLYRYLTAERQRAGSKHR